MPSKQLRIDSFNSSTITSGHSDVAEHTEYVLQSQSEARSPLVFVRCLHRVCTKSESKSSTSASPVPKQGLWGIVIVSSLHPPMKIWERLLWMDRFVIGRYNEFEVNCS